MLHELVPTALLQLNLFKNGCFLSPWVLSSSPVPPSLPTWAHEGLLYLPHTKVDSVRRKLLFSSHITFPTICWRTRFFFSLHIPDFLFPCLDQPRGSVVAAEAMKCDPQSESPHCRCADTPLMARERKMQEERAAAWGLADQLTVMTSGHRLGHVSMGILNFPSGSVQQGWISSVFAMMQPKPERNVSVDPIKIETSLS